MDAQQRPSANRFCSNSYSKGLITVHKFEYLRISNVNFSRFHASDIVLIQIEDSKSF